MKYYLLRFKDGIPDKFSGQTCWMFIWIRPKLSNDIGLLEHEKAHVRQWYFWLAVGLLLGTMLNLLVSPSLWPLLGLAPFLHQLLYKFVRPYRCWCEVQAYRKQIAVGGYLSNNFAVAALVEKYGLKLFADKARALLFD